MTGYVLDGDCDHDKWCPCSGPISLHSLQELQLGGHFMTFSASISCQQWWEIFQEGHGTLHDAYIETGIHQIMSNYVNF